MHRVVSDDVRRRRRYNVFFFRTEFSVNTNTSFATCSYAILFLLLHFFFLHYFCRPSNILFIYNVPVEYISLHIAVRIAA